MNKVMQNRLIGLQILALLVTFAGETLGVSLLVTVGVPSFFLALFAFMAVSTVSLIGGLSHDDGEMLEPAVNHRNG